MKQEEFQILKNNEKLNEIYKSVEKTRAYFKWTLIITFVFLILPLMVLPFIVGNFLAAYDLSTLGL